MRASEKQMGEGGNCLMSHQSYIRAALEVIEAQFRLFVLKAAFHAPPRESHLEQHAQGRFARRMDDEELELLRFQDVAGHDQVSPFLRQAIHAARIEPDVLDFPDHRTFRAVFNVPGLPRLIPQFGILHQHFAHRAERRSPRHHTRLLGLAPAPSPAARRHSRLLDPAGASDRHFRHEALPAGPQSIENPGAPGLP